MQFYLVGGILFPFIQNHLKIQVDEPQSAESRQGPVDESRGRKESNREKK